MVLLTLGLLALPYRRRRWAGADAELLAGAVGSSKATGTGVSQMTAPLSVQFCAKSTASSGDVIDTSCARNVALSEG